VEKVGFGAVNSLQIVLIQLLALNNGADSSVAVATDLATESGQVEQLRP
jgi:hypothetical protein